jgi:hypothetical protein
MKTQNLITMKTKKLMKKITLIALAAIGFSVNANAQTPSSATAEVNANIVEPIVISKTQDMVFSDIAVTGGGTVTLDTYSALTTSGVGVSLPATSTPVSAEFHVTGSAGYLYNYSVPSNFKLWHSNNLGTDSINVSSITSRSASAGTPSISTLSPSGPSAGTDDIFFGATITLAAAQLPGFYRNLTAFQVTVNYN